MRVRGNKIGVFVKGGDVATSTIVGLSTSCSLDVSADIIEIASSASRAKANRSGRYGYTLSIDCLLDVEGGMQAHLLRSLLSGDVLDWKMSPVGLPVAGVTFSGRALVSGFSPSASVDGYATARVSMTGTGELEVITD